MKKLFILLLISSTATAQNYEDSTITINATQRLAWWVGKHVEQSFKWSDRNAPAQLKQAIGSGTRPDSTFTVTLKAGYIKGAIEQLISRPLLVVIDDYRSIVLDLPDVPNYSGLAQQIIAKSNGNTSEKNVATWLLNWFNERKAAYQALYDEEKSKVIQWSNY